MKLAFFDYLLFTSLIQKNVILEEYSVVINNGIAEVSGTGELNFTFQQEIFNQSVNEIVVKDGFTSIGNYTFELLHDVNKISIPDTVTSIGLYCFFYCGAKSIKLSQNIQTIPYMCFFNCSNLTDINIPNECKHISENAFWGTSSLQTVSGSNVNEIENCAFYLSGVTKAYFPTLTKIGELAFFRCFRLQEITQSLKFVPKACFHECYSLGKFDFSFIEDSISDQSFGCTGFEQIIFPNNLHIIGIGAFENCTNLRNISFIENRTSDLIIEHHAFTLCKSLTEINLPKNCTITIKDSVFHECSSLTYFYVPKGLIYFEPDSLSISPNLAWIDVDSENPIFKSINGVLFSEDGENHTIEIYPPKKNDTSYTIPDFVTKISDWCFTHCFILKEVVFPLNLHIILPEFIFNSPSIETLVYCGKHAIHLTPVSIESSVKEILVSKNYPHDTLMGIPVKYTDRCPYSNDSLLVIIMLCVMVFLIILCIFIAYFVCTRKKRRPKSLIETLI